MTTSNWMWRGSHCTASSFSTTLWGFWTSLWRIGRPVNGSHCLTESTQNGIVALAKKVLEKEGEATVTRSLSIGSEETSRGLMMKENQAVTQLAVEYKRATKRQEGRILEMSTKLISYNPSCAARVLRQRARYIVAG